MAFLGKYGLSLICGAMVCSLVAGMVWEGLFQKQLKLLCGLFLALTIVKPLLQLELPELDDLLKPFGEEADAAAAWGTEIYRSSVNQGIQQEIAAYIRSKAEAHGVNLLVQVALNDDTPPLPKWVTLEGSVPSDVKKELQEMMERELNLPKERQTWIGQR